MNDETILLMIYYSYLLIPNRKHFFLFMYSILIISNISKLFQLIFSPKLQIKKRIIIFLKYAFCYLLSYFLIKDPNPFYNLFTFYLPFPDLFKGIFIIIFISFFLNKKVFDIKIEEEESKKDKEKEEEKLDYFLSKYFSYFKNNKIKFFLLLLFLIGIKICIYLYNIKFWIYFSSKEEILSSDNINNTKYYICSIICNAETIIVDWISQLKLLIDFLGKENVYISILENADSKDNTAIYLSDFKNYLDENNIKNKKKSE